MNDDVENICFEPIDFGRLSQLLGNNDEAAIFEYLGIFRRIFPDLITEIATAISNHDARALHHAAHKAKSAASSAAAPELVRILRDLETKAVEESWDVFQAEFSRLESEYARIERFCEDYRH